MQEFIKGPKIQSIKQADHSKDGYIIAQSATKNGKMLAVPKDGIKNYPCLLFNASSNIGKFKGFQVKIPQEKAYLSEPMNERMVAFTLRVILIAETHVQREGEEVIGVGASVSRVIGDTFKD